jgi:hypothetical protein
MQDVTHGGRRFFVGSCKRLFRKGGAINFSQSLFATSIIATSENIFCNSLLYQVPRSTNFNHAPNYFIQSEALEEQECSSFPTVNEISATL